MLAEKDDKISELQFKVDTLQTECHNLTEYQVRVAAHIAVV